MLSHAFTIANILNSISIIHTQDIWIEKTSVSDDDNDHTRDRECSLIKVPWSSDWIVAGNEPLCCKI